MLFNKKNKAAETVTEPVNTPPAATEIFERINDYTLSVIYDFNRMTSADPELRRIFNFKAQQVTEIYTMWYSSSVTSNMNVQRFSDLDSLEEVHDMRRKLIELDGKPPELTVKKVERQFGL